MTWSATSTVNRCKAQPDSRAYRLRKFVTRNALPVAAGSAVLIALGIGLGVALWQANEARDQAAARHCPEHVRAWTDPAV